MFEEISPGLDWIGGRISMTMTRFSSGGELHASDNHDEEPNKMILMVAFRDHRSRCFLD